jgi:ADP-heptose:LPS heptosyltransferase|tara:strand:+ start:1349 stop:2350 length:1002 start_codon:yes stop_codon:yes gene_type:complete
MKICVSRIDKMGDMILTLPVIKTIKIENPNAEVHVLSSELNFKIIKDLQYIDNMYVIKPSIFSFFKELIDIRKNQYDLFLNFSPSLKSFFLCLLSKSDKKSSLILKSRYKNRHLSKIFTIILGKIFFNNLIIVNRYKNLIKNKEIHQTKMMFNLLEINKIQNNILTKIDLKLPNKKIDFKNKIITIHLSEKWINPYYSEKNFIQLLEMIILKNYQIILTTDNLSKKKFHKIFQKFKIYDHLDEKKIIACKDIVILDNLNYQSWLKVIYSSSKVITPECGCSHIAAACKIHVSIIYDPFNYPDAIHDEYHPWHSQYSKFIFTKENLNQKLVQNL